MLNLEETRPSPLRKGPHLSLSRSLREYTKDAAGYRLPASSSAENYRKRLAKERNRSDGRDCQVIDPVEENMNAGFRAAHQREAAPVAAHSPEGH